MPSEYSILTPEKVAVRFRVAGIGSRLLAHLLDAVLIIVGGTLVVSMIATAASVLSEGLAILVLSIGTLLLLFGYFILCEGLCNGRTLGKLAAGIRVRMTDGSPITFGAAFTRNILRPADFLPSFYAVGIIAAFFTERSQRLGDLVADTIVVHERRNVSEVPTSSPLTTTAHPLEHLVGDLRTMSMEEYLAVKTLCDRYPQLPRPVADRLVRDVWNPVANRLGIRGYADVHPVYLMEAVVMRFARSNGLL